MTYRGEYKTMLGAAAVIKTADNESFVLTGEIFIEDDLLKSDTFEELRKETEHFLSPEEMNRRAEKAYYGAIQYINAPDHSGLSVSDVLLIFFYEEDPEKGESLAGTAEYITDGYRFIIDYMDKEYGIKDGYVYLGEASISGEDTFFVQYKTDYGFIGQYPLPITKDKAKEVEWGTCLGGNEKNKEKV